MQKFERCRGTGCELPLLNGDKVLWCKHPKCPETSQRWPTERQVEELKIGEKEPKKLA